MAIFGLKLSPDTHDLVLTDGRIQVVSDEEVVARNLETRISTFRGEWVLDNTYGYEYANVLGARTTDLQLIESTLKAYILDTVDVVSISSFKLSYLPGEDRRLVVSFGVLTIYSSIINIEDITLG